MMIKITLVIESRVLPNITEKKMKKTFQANNFKLFNNVKCMCGYCASIHKFFFIL